MNYDTLYKSYDQVYCYIKNNLLVEKGKKVAVKLNLLGPLKPELAATTHPAVVSLTVDILISLGCEVMLCEDIDGFTTIKETGIFPVLEKFKLPFYNLREYGYKDIEVYGRTYKYSKLIDTCDVLIEIPKFKTHMLTNYTGAVKNMFGCINKEQRKETHKLIDEDDFANALCSIYSIREPDIIIMDAIIAMEGMGPSFGTPKYLGNLVLGTDGVLVDYYCTKMTGFDIKQLKTLQHAIRRNLSVFKSEEDFLPYLPQNIDSKDELYRLPIYDSEDRQTYISVLRRLFKIDYDICIKCGKCKEVCPFGAIEMENNIPKNNTKKCNLCICCMELCPVGAIRLIINNK